MFGRVHAGMPLRQVSEKTFNRILDATEIVERGVNQRGSATAFDLSPQIVRIKNSGEIDCPRGGVLHVTDTLIDPDVVPDEFWRMPVFLAETPASNNGITAVALETIPQNGIGKARLDGVVRAMVRIDAEGDVACGTTAGSVYLRSGSGSYDLLSHATPDEESPDDPVMAWVRLRHGGCQSQNEQQLISVAGTPDGGTLVIRITPTGEVSRNVEVPYNATADDVEQAIWTEFGLTEETKPVSATGGPLPTSNILLEFVGSYQRTEIPAIICDWSGLTGGYGVFALAVPVAKGRAS